MAIYHTPHVCTWRTYASDIAINHPPTIPINGIQYCSSWGVGDAISTWGGPNRDRKNIGFENPWPMVNNTHLLNRMLSPARATLYSMQMQSNYKILVAIINAIGGTTNTMRILILQDSIMACHHTSHVPSKSIIVGKQ